MQQPDTSHINPDNRAYQRFLALAEEHFTVQVWKRASDDLPVMLSLHDLEHGDTFTVALMNTVEDNAPHLTLAVDPQARLTAHGILCGATAASRYALELAQLCP